VGENRIRTAINRPLTAQNKRRRRRFFSWVVLAESELLLWRMMNGYVKGNK
jgi:hypothetical protein